MNANPKPSWLALAMQESAAKQTEQATRTEKWAADVAQAINDRLAELEITPLNRAATDGQGHVIPAILLAAVPEENLFEVHATYDEESDGVTLLGAAHDDPELRDLGLLISHCYPAEARSRILCAYENGPAPLPPAPVQLSPDTEALVDALKDIQDILCDIYRHGIGQI